MLASLRGVLHLFVQVGLEAGVFLMFSATMEDQSKVNQSASLRSFDLLSRIEVRPLPVCFIWILGFNPKLKSMTSLGLLAHGLEDRLQRSQFSCGDVH